MRACGIQFDDTKLRYGNDYDELRLNNVSDQRAEETSPLSLVVFRLLPPLGADLRPRLAVAALVLDRFLPRAGLGVAVPSSASFTDSCGPDCAGAECPKNSSPSSVHKSRVGAAGAFDIPPVSEAIRPGTPLEESRLASWSSFSRSWTISLGLVASVNVLFPTTIS